MTLMTEKVTSEVWRGIITLIAAGIIALVGTNFTSSSAGAQKRIETLESHVDELRLFVAKQSVFNDNVQAMLREMQDERMAESNRVHKKSPQ